MKKITIYFIALLFVYLLVRYSSFIWSLLAPFIGALALTYLANPFVKNLGKKNIPPSVASALFYIIVIGIFTFTLWFIIPALLNSLRQMSNELPTLVKKFENLLAGRYTDVLAAANEWFDDFLANSAKSLVKMIGGTVAFLADLLIAIIMSFYFLQDTKKIKAASLSIIPSSWHDEIIGTAREMNIVISGYVRSQMIIGVIIAASTGLALWALGVKYSLLLGILAGIFDFIPYIGAPIASIPIIAIAYLDGPAKALWALLALIIIQQIENNLITPRVCGNSVGIGPAAAIFAVYVCTKLFGFWGILLGIPIFAIAKIILRRTMSHIT